MSLSVQQSPTTLPISANIPGRRLPQPQSNNMAGMMLPADTFQRRSATETGAPLPAAVAATTTPQRISASSLQQSDAIKRFAVIGDAGVGHQRKYALEEGGGGEGQDDIAKGMMQEFEKKPFASMLLMGDNVYPWGQRKYFDSDIKKPYQPFKDQGVRFYPILGNHDIQDPTQGGDQLRYWGMPRYYKASLGNVDVFGIDTTLFFPGYDRGTAYKNNPQQARQAAFRQLQWLDTALAESNAKYKVVCGHFPLHSQNEKLEPPGMQETLRQLLMPTLERNGVDAYLAGHHHAYERTDVETGKMAEFVSGAGGRVLSSKEIGKVGMTPVPPLKVFIPQRHFMVFEDTPTGLAFKAVAQNGQTLDQGLLAPKPGRHDRDNRQSAV